jgi:hypothetical protein
MYKLENPIKVVCVQNADGLTIGKEYFVIGNNSDSYDPFDCNWFVENDDGKTHGYYTWRFKKV